MKSKAKGQSGLTLKGIDAGKISNIMTNQSHHKKKGLKKKHPFACFFCKLKPIYYLQSSPWFILCLYLTFMALLSMSHSSWYRAALEPIDYWISSVTATINNTKRCTWGSANKMEFTARCTKLVARWARKSRLFVIFRESQNRPYALPLC